MWQRDALRRIVNQEDITDEDVTELSRLCIEQFGIIDEDHRAQNAQPLSLEHLPPGEGPLERVRLIGIRDVAGVNTLAPGQSMGFAPDGMTIVFGYNGSGKSGYARILRMLCHARHRGALILPDAFSSDEPPVPSATVDYRVGEANRELQWRQDEESPIVLQQACFFDADCAVVHVDSSNELAFTPFGLDVLQKLAGICQRLSESLQTLIVEQTARKSASLVEPKALLGTDVRQQIDGINKDTDIGVFRTLSEVSEPELVRLEELHEALGTDPASRAREIRNAISRLERLKVITHAVELSLSTDAVEAARTQLLDWVAKDQAATTAAENIFRAQPLSGVGEAVWQQLWSAACAYSITEAYQNEEFPNVGDNSLCVLCQQPLSPDAKDRLANFERFIRAETQQVADDAKALVEITASTMNNLVVGRSAIIEYLVDIGDDHNELRRRIRLFHGLAWKVCRKILASFENHQWAMPPNLPVPPLPEIEQLIQNLARRVEELDRASNEEVRAELLLERNELLARQWLSEVLTDIESEISRKQYLAALDEAKRTTVTTGITRKSSELTGIYVTAAIKDRLAAEIREVGAQHLRIELVPQGGQQGALRFKIALQGADGEVRVRQVLSEGEFRCIAIAGFLAELSTEGSSSSLIFDDPVSSLDHRWRRKVAKRLVAEASRRQVIIFTHEIGFLSDLTDFCVARDVPLQNCYLRRALNYAGECLDGLPWPAMKVRDRIGVLKRRQQDAAALLRREGVPAYEPAARQIYGLLRETWERCVEELLINGAVVRFQREIQTQRLRHLTDITENDLQVIENGMTKCSRFLEGHDEAGAVMDPVPDPDELLADITMLEEWVTQMRPRRR